jgi:hypothetical protein
MLLIFPSFSSTQRAITRISGGKMKVKVGVCLHVTCVAQEENYKYEFPLLSESRKEKSPKRRVSKIGAI